METKEIISPYFEYGTFAGVRVCVGDEDFVIAPKDYVDVAVSWEYAEKALEKDGISTWDYRQACFTIAYQDEINNVLEANGGDALAYYWTCTRADGTEMYIHGNKHLTTCTDNWTCFLRAVINLKLFPTFS